ncbi:hypothetical protein F4805DRAFT_459181 [Annulohypoxylon moriforme]|nr:hypothetical protein F4805DRAFT_459181 [Annulohypoxylon moriforme]
MPAPNEIEDHCHYCREFPSLDWSAVRCFVRLSHHPSFATLRESSKNGCKLCIFLCRNLVRCVATYSGDKPIGVSWEENVAAEWLLAKDEASKGFVLETAGNATDDTPHGEDDLVDGFFYMRESWGAGRACNVRVATPKGKKASALTANSGCFSATRFTCEFGNNGSQTWNLRGTGFDNARITIPFALHRRRLPPPPDAYPTRLLRIASHSSELIAVSLIESRNTRAPTMKITRGVRLQDLPASFRHAVLVTRSFGFEFLWIDSLCIVQYSREDWERECPRMVDIYSNAAVTIAASDAEDSSRGFLHDYPPVDADVIEPGVSASPKSDKRVEDINTEREVFQYWQEVAETFADCSLTYISDRLPALSGLASRFSLQLNDGYVAGIWRRDIHAGLSWNVVHRDQFDPKFPQLPLCSYLESTKREFDEPGRMQLGLQISSVEIVHSGTIPFGNVSSGLLKANCQMKSCILGDGSQNRNQYEDVYDQESTAKIATLLADCWRIQELRGVNREHRRDITALFLAKCDSDGDDISLWLALALQPVYDANVVAGRNFRRVGLIIWSSNSSDCAAGKTWFENGVCGCLTIV